MKRITLFFLLTGLFCTAPIREYLETRPPTEEKQADTIRVSLPQQIPQPVNLNIKDWPGKRFVVLKKQEIFCRQGYELYGCKDPNSCKEKHDSSRVNADHRIRCEKLEGHVLEVKDIEPANGEWRVTFTDEQTGKLVYGKTYKGAIKEIALESDLEWARKRWLNKTVFSRKGILSTALEGETGLGSSKIRIQDSLKVKDVSWGVTPLPVNPIWLTVQTSIGVEGFIPVRYSWTNTMSDQMREGEAWRDDILEKDPVIAYSWDPTVWELINNHRIVIEMTREQVFLSWGEPIIRKEKEYGGENRECWVYGSQELYFNDKGLIATLEITTEPPAFK